MLLAAVILPVACNEKWEPDGVDTADKGTLSTADLAVDLANAENVIARSRASIDLSNFIVTVTDKDGLAVNTWTYATMPGLPVFNVGTYTLKVESGKPAKSAWDAPYFVGEKQFTIVKDQVTNAGTITCTLQNLKVTVRFTDDLVAASAGDLECEIRVNEDGVLKFNPSETRSGYFEIVPGNTTMVATFTGTVNNYKEEIIRLYKDLNPGQHRIITFALKGADINPPAETGFIDPTGGLNVDFSVIDEDLNANIGAEEDVIGGDRPGHEDWPDEPGTEDPDHENPNPPVDDDVISFNSEYLDTEEGNSNVATKYGTEDWGDDLLPAIIDITAVNGIKNLKVKINSVGLDVTEVGLKNEFDLAYPEELETALRGLKFPVGDEVINNTSILFDISEFIPMLPNFEGPHIFIIEVIDNKDNSKTLNLTFVNE